jgi:hypothetical protein
MQPDTATSLPGPRWLRRRLEAAASERLSRPEGSMSTLSGKGLGHPGNFAQ